MKCKRARVEKIAPFEMHICVPSNWSSFQQAHALWCNQIKIFQFHQRFMRRNVRFWLVWCFLLVDTTNQRDSFLCVHMTVLLFTFLLCFIDTFSSFFYGLECNAAKEGYFFLWRNRVAVRIEFSAHSAPDNFIWLLTSKQYIQLDVVVSKDEKN